jgi:lipopolysaccharide export system permease protein
MEQLRLFEKKKGKKRAHDLPESPRPPVAEDAVSRQKKRLRPAAIWPGKLLFGHFVKEFSLPFGLNLLYITLVFMTTTIPKITNLVVNYSVSLGDVLLLIVYSIPYFLVFVIPMSTMMAILLSFMRFSSDNEIVAMKSSGISLYGMLPPVILFCLSTFLLNLFMTIYATPWSARSLERLTLNVATRHLEVGIKARTFNDSFKDVMLYVNEIDQDTSDLIDVYIEDQRTPDTVTAVTAQRGVLFTEPQNG